MTIPAKTIDILGNLAGLPPKTVIEFPPAEIGD